ncbi:NAD(P)/FAD-dependent oxidoreductase [Streptomyces sp. SID13666]|uniref:phytoene desaturase family protein n=1 Tax=unclassified Streptomyces TaxID=2593676 RepID=UPI0013C0178A|nr:MULTISPECIES: NAD(P)/FAD-dependent oxidoreductase [unclassified Streptomyces]NEA59793.1 NAD(P)/FAD-dependent oxidoreductase [Streptomyces sp. SID13666]NEA76784.1 NAD(P)/FAD-dependent oxidoreductase [Streptomyces sp. SID13588]
MPETFDAIVVGAGPNGLVAANVLADAGWAVLVLEEQSVPGGAVRSDREVHPEYVNDLFSAFYPLAMASPAISTLELHRWGLRWSHAPHVLAHPLADGRCAVLDRDRQRTADNLDGFGSGDGEAYLRLVEVWDRLGPDVIRSLFAPFPPIRSSLALVAKARAASGLRLMRMLTLPVRRLAEEEFTGQGGALLLAGCALHADFAPESTGSAGFGWLMSTLGQQFGWPVPVGGAGALTDALVRRFHDKGGIVRSSERVDSVVVRNGRATGVVTEHGRQIRAARAVLADVPAPALYGGLVDWEELPARLRDDMRRFQWDYATFKVDWALSGPIPWTAQAAAGAGTVHLADGLDHMTRFSAQLATGQVPDRPFALLGQMTTADPSRSPAGTESAWAYTHLPQHVRGDAGEGGLTGRWDPGEREIMADRVEREVERLAPGFRNRIEARRILAPPDLQARDANLMGGALNGGTASLHQQAFLRPGPGTGRSETPIVGLYLASASAHPGGGVHGACGANAARSALRSQTAWRRHFAAPALTALERAAAAPRGLRGR